MIADPPLVGAPLFLLDYDGTLAPIVERPEAATPHPEVPPLLRTLAARHPLWILTGRKVDDLARLLPLPGVTAIGVHGLEQGELTGGSPVASRLGDKAARLLDEARAALPALPDGSRVEDKGTAIAVHYRGVPDAEAARGVLRAWTGSLPEGLDSIWGKMVVEVRPAGFDKGSAAAGIAARHQGHTPVMIGDDTTDEDAFEQLRGASAVTIKVGAGETAARYRLADVEAVVGYLKRYLV